MQPPVKQTKAIGQYRVNLITIDKKTQLILLTVVTNMKVVPEMVVGSASVGQQPGCTPLGRTKNRLNG